MFTISVFCTCLWGLVPLVTFSASRTSSSFPSSQPVGFASVPGDAAPHVGFGLDSPSPLPLGLHIRRGTVVAELAVPWALRPSDGFQAPASVSGSLNGMSVALGPLEFVPFGCHGALRVCRFVCLQIWAVVSHPCSRHSAAPSSRSPWTPGGYF